MLKQKLLIALWMVFLACPSVAFAVNASPHTVRLKQPDGTPVALRLRGNEFHHWYEDLEGYLVTTRQARGGSIEYVYAEPAARGESTLASDRLVGKDSPPDGLQRSVVPPRPTSRRLNVLEANVNSPHNHEHSDSGKRFKNLIEKLGDSTRSTSVEVQNLVIPIRFKGHASRSLPSVADFDLIFNANGGHPDHMVGSVSSGSVRDFYLECSYDTFELASTIEDWVDVSQDEAYYADGDSGTEKLWEALKEALDIVQARWASDPNKNFKKFDQDDDGFIDAITFVHSGYAAEFGGVSSDGADFKDRIWSHRWVIGAGWDSSDGVKVRDYHINPSLWGTSGNEPGHIGVICHETGHFFGLPDLYDTSQSGEGIGSWGIMANSWGFDMSQLYPPHFSAWSKHQLGWVVPKEITQAGKYQVSVAERKNPDIYKIPLGNPKEYLLIENRQFVAFNQLIPSGMGGRGGLAIWHIDESKPDNADPGWPPSGSGWPSSHYMIALMQADGSYELEKGQNRGDGDDVARNGFVDRFDASTTPSTSAYGQSTGVTISQISNSAEVMTFRLNSDVPDVGGGGEPAESENCCPITRFAQLVWDGDNPNIHSADGVILQVQIELPREMDVHLSGSTSISSSSSAASATTGFYNDDTGDHLVWPGSFRGSDVTTPNTWMNTSNEYAVRMPKGMHTFYWKIWTDDPIEFDSAVMTVKAFDIAPDTSASRSPSVPKLLDLKGSGPAKRARRTGNVRSSR